MVLQVDQHLDFLASAVLLEVSLHNSHFPWLALFDFFRFWAGPLLLELVHPFTHRPHFRRVCNRRSSCRRCALQSSTKLATAAVVVEVTAANRTAARLSFPVNPPPSHYRHVQVSTVSGYCQSFPVFGPSGRLPEASHGPGATAAHGGDSGGPVRQISLVPRKLVFSYVRAVPVTLFVGSFSRVP
jgi:hypothetical protein